MDAALEVQAQVQDLVDEGVPALPHAFLIGAGPAVKSEGGSKKRSPHNQGEKDENCFPGGSGHEVSEEEQTGVLSPLFMGIRRNELGLLRLLSGIPGQNLSHGRLIQKHLHVIVQLNFQHLTLDRDHCGVKTALG